MMIEIRRSVGAGTLGSAIMLGCAMPVGAGPLPVVSGEQIAGESITQSAHWYGWGPGWGGALAAGAIVGGALGLAAAATAPINPYWYGYPVDYPAYYAYPGFARPYHRVYWRAYGWPGYSYPGYRYGYRRAYWHTGYGWGYPRVYYRRSYWY